MADWNLNAFEVIFYTFGGFIIFFAPVLGFVALFFLVVASLLWSPFAAAICGRIARKNGLDPEPNEYGRAGFVCSCYLFVPWVYLISRMRGKPLDAALVIVAYFMLFPLWMFGTFFPAIGLSWALFWAENGAFGPFGSLKGLYDPSDTILSLVFSIAPALIALALWAISLWKICRAYRRYRRGTLPTSQSALIDRTYLRPFQYTLLSFALVWIPYIYILVLYNNCLFDCG